LNTRIRSPRDFFTGVAYLSFGVCAVLVARDYPMVTALRMGAGYFPFALFLLLIVVVLPAVRKKREEAFQE